MLFNNNINNNRRTYRNMVANTTIKKTRRKCFIFGAISVITLAITVLYIAANSPEISYYRLLTTYESKSIPNNTKTILLWTPFFQSPNWYLPSDVNNQSYFEEQNCPVTNCLITSNHQYLPSELTYDAVLFHGAEGFSMFNSVPSVRRPEQMYVLVIIESPAHTKHELSSDENFYNMTITYRLDSDIVWPYGTIVDKQTDFVIAPAIKPKWRKPPTNFAIDEPTASHIANKTKFAAWFVSHCYSLSRRDDLTKEIQKHMEVDVYGKCGPLVCPRQSKKCDEYLDKDYRFYFSFENSLCRDYVTEKFFNALQRDVVPVVYGGSDYSRFAPPHSYINAQDFDTPEELASYLIYLSNNPNEYKKYFWWKKYYKVSYRSPYCDLCIKLNNPAEEQKMYYYKDIKEWWFGNSCNLKSKIKF